MASYEIDRQRWAELSIFEQMGNIGAGPRTGGRFPCAGAHRGTAVHGSLASDDEAAAQRNRPPVTLR